MEPEGWSGHPVLPPPACCPAGAPAAAQLSPPETETDPACPWDAVFPRWDVVQEQERYWEQPVTQPSAPRVPPPSPLRFILSLPSLSTHSITFPCPFSPALC